MYDIAVYLPGGAVTLLALEALASKFDVDHLHLAMVPSGNSAIEQVILGVVWLSASYLLGHVVAFASSYAIEKFVHYSLGYPSDIWLKSERLLHHGEPRRQTFRKIIERNLHDYPYSWVSITILILQIPAGLALLAFRWSRPFGFYNHKLPHGILSDVSSRFSVLNLSVQIKEKSRWEKIVEHYIASNCMPAYTRMYNYLVIYGSLRILAIIILGYLWYLFASDVALKTKVPYDIFSNISIEATIYYLGFSMLYVVTVMAFAKFNRRYFEETILAFLLATGSDLKVPVQPRLLV